MIVCWFSCGAASACAAKLVIEKYGKGNVRVVNNPVINEHEDNRRFLKDCENWLGVKIESAINPCFKHCDITKVFVGYTVEEKQRQERFNKSEKNKGYFLWCPLIDTGWDKHKCFAVLEQAGIKLPEIYTKYEFPNANCIGCVKSGSVWYWQLVRKYFPDIFKQRAEQSRKLNCRLVDLGAGHDPRHIFLDELPETATGRKPKSCYVECGIFCTLGGEQ